MLPCYTNFNVSYYSQTTTSNWAFPGTAAAWSKLHNIYKIKFKTLKLKVIGGEGGFCGKVIGE
jgi:hypothetical protein